MPNIDRTRSGNPTLRVIGDALTAGSSTTEQMTIRGTVGKTAVLFVLLLISAGWTWWKFFAAGPQAVEPFMMGGVIGGLVLALATVFKPNWAAITAPLYAIVEGLFIGGVSALFAVHYGPVVLQAVMLTLGVMAGMLILYASGTIRVTQRFYVGVMAATFGVMLFYLATWVLGFFHVATGFLFFGSTTSIVISLAFVAIAALNLVLDFDFINRAAKAGAPQYLEWYGAFALMVTLIWLYLEALRLMANLNGR